MFPYVILTILAVKALSLEGAMDGVRFLFTPDWDRLKMSECWIDGGTQIFYSYGVGIGALLALGSYNKFNQNCYRYALFFGVPQRLDAEDLGRSTGIMTR